MFQRCVSLLVLAGFLASQLAAMPHAHGVDDGEQRDLSTKRHFHWAWFVDVHGDHDHTHLSHRHTHAGHGCSYDAPQESEAAQTGLVVGQWTCGDHDFDAVFVPEPTVGTSPQHDPQAWQLASIVALPEELGQLVSAGERPVPWHPPDEILDASDTYLTLRMLRL